MRGVQLVRQIVSIPFVRSIGPYLGVSTVMFHFLAIVGLAVGYRNASSSPLPGGPSADGNLESIELSAVDLFVHNSIVCLQLMGGVLTLGVLTVAIVAINGMTIGSVAGEATMTFGPVLTAALIVPHGIFEIPALLIATAIGFQWTHVLWRIASGKRRRFSVPRHFLHTLGWMAITGSLLAVAAFIEAELTLSIATAVS